MVKFSTKGRIFTILVAFALLGQSSLAEPVAEKLALLRFITEINYKNNLVKWNPFTSVCNWTGVICNRAETHICELRLPGVALTGQILVNTISHLNQLRVLNLCDNRLYGPVPYDWGNLTSLTDLFMQNNHFYGRFPEAILTLPRLVRLDISHNGFEGRVPASIKNLVLETLFLQDNMFSGEFPMILNTSMLSSFNISNNNLSGEIPNTLSKFPESSFSGNVRLCGDPLPECNDVSEPPTPAPSNVKVTHRLPTHILAIINVLCVVAFLFLVAFLVYWCMNRCSKRRPRKALSDNSGNSLMQFSESSWKDQSVTEMTKSNKLIFLEEGKYGFDLQSLLSAPAEVLGKGSTGTSYKAKMGDGTTVTIKRLKEIIVGKKDFDTHLPLLGQLKHENVVKLIAYYYCKDEKLVISEFVPSGSLSSLLHGTRGSGRPPMDWITRFKIGLTAARGLQHIHEMAKLPHGNIKSCNILVTQSLEACLSDYGMHSLFGPVAPIHVAGYKAPEVQQQVKMISFKSDVYSFGVVLLEMLTGKSPDQVAVGEEGVGLPRWVQSVAAQSVAAEEFEAEVFDAEILGNGAVKEMVAVLQVAMKCVELVAESRPEMSDVVRMLEMVESGEDFSPVSLSSNMQ